MIYFALFIIFFVLAFIALSALVYIDCMKIENRKYKEQRDSLQKNIDRLQVKTLEKQLTKYE